MSSGSVFILVIGGLLLAVIGVLAYSFLATRESGSFPAPAAQAFHDRCVSAGASELTCGCLLDEMEQRYTLDELIRLGLQAQDTGRIPAELSGLLALCGQ